MSKVKSEYDNPWKEVMDIYFKEFMELCWHEHYQQINWQRGYRTLDKELAKISRDAPIGNREADKLIEVSLNDGNDAFVLIHIEIQAKRDSRFAERMLLYRYRIRDLYKKPIASLAILIDAEKNWRPQFFSETFWGSKLEIQFPIIKLIDYRNQIAELENSTNPFSQVILAQLVALEKQDQEKRLISKIELTRHLYIKGWGKDDILSLYKFLDWVLALPPSYELNYVQAIEKIEQEMKVTYITSAERVGIEKGIQQGIQQGIEQGKLEGLQEGIEKGRQEGEREILMDFLKDKFKDIPFHFQRKIEQAEKRSILDFLKRAAVVKTIEEVFED